MKSFNRRQFVIGSPLCLSALLEGAGIDAAIAATAEAQDPAALDFWTRGMGVPLGSITSAARVGVGQTRSAHGPSSVSAFAQEPIFLHYHEGDKVFIQAEQIPKSNLLDSGDTAVTLQMQRLRLNANDNLRFAKYTSGGIYFEMQQAQAAATPANNPGLPVETIIQFATTVLSVFKPAPAATKSKSETTTPTTPSSDTKTSSNKTGSKFLDTSAASSPKAAGAPIPLQSSRQAQTLALPNGVGKAAFSAFVKDPRKSAFGQVLDALASTGGGTSPLYAQLLSLPLLSVPGLASVRAAVANLQLHGSSQEILMQSPPTDFATTAAALSSSAGALPLREGSYLVVPRDHAGVTLDEINKCRLVNGFLVPKEVKDTFDVDSHMVTVAVPLLSYLSLKVGVKKAKVTTYKVEQ